MRIDQSGPLMSGLTWVHVLNDRIANGYFGVMLKEPNLK